jgi:anti-sigma factor RsiW
MTCTQYTEAIGDLVDGTLGPIRRAELQTHLDVCETCRALVADLQAIRGAAASLDAVQPPPHVWLQVANRLRQEGRVSSTPQLPRRHYAMLALAATLVLSVGAAVYLLIPAGGPQSAAPVAEGRPAAPAGDTGAGGNAGSTDPVQSVADELRLAEQHFQAAMSKLEAAAQADPESVTPETVATIKSSADVINEAIGASRAALQTDPQSTAARTTYFQALRQKVTLLQNTIALMNEMRKGNSAGAAQLVDEANKS